MSQKELLPSINVASVYRAMPQILEAAPELSGDVENQRLRNVNVGSTIRAVDAKFHASMLSLAVRMIESGGDYFGLVSKASGDLLKILESDDPQKRTRLSVRMCKGVLASYETDRLNGGDPLSVFVRNGIFDPWIDVIRYVADNGDRIVRQIGRCDREANQMMRNSERVAGIFAKKTNDLENAARQYDESLGETESIKMIPPSLYHDGLNVIEALVTGKPVSRMVSSVGSKREMLSAYPTEMKRMTDSMARVYQLLLSQMTDVAIVDAMSSGYRAAVLAREGQIAALILPPVIAINGITKSIVAAETWGTALMLDVLARINMTDYGNIGVNPWDWAKEQINVSWRAIESGENNIVGTVGDDLEKAKGGVSSVVKSEGSGPIQRRIDELRSKRQR